MTKHPTLDGLDRSTGEEEHGGLLRLAFKLDAVASGALGALSLIAGTVLDDLLGIPLALLVPIGLFLLAYAAFVWVVGTRRWISPTAAWAVVAANLLWVTGSVVFVLAGWSPMTALGIAFVLVQAAAVLLFADLQVLGLRRVRRAVPSVAA